MKAQVFDNLLAPGVDDPRILAAAQAKGFALAGRYFDHVQLLQRA